MTIRASEASGSRRRADPAWIAGAAFALALLVRTLYLFSIRHAYFFEHLQTEPLRYDAWATAILRGDAPVRPPFDEAPAYPYFVAGVYAIAGHKVFAVAALQAALDALSCAAAALIAQRAAGDRAGWIAGVLAALFGPTIYFTGQLEPATLAVLAVSAAMLATPLDAGAPARRFTLAGAAWALGLAVRSELVLALPVVLWHAQRLGGRRGLARAALAPAMVLAASLAINAASSGHAVLLTTGAGANLWIGNNPHADGVSPFVGAPMAPVARRVEATARDAVEADALFRAEALAFVRAEPRRAARLALRKLVWLWSERELPNAADIDWQTGQSWVFGARAVPLGLGIMVPLAAAGAVLLGRGWRRLTVLAAPVVVAVIVAVVFFTNARFRLVLAPTLTVLAAIGIDRALDRRALRPLRGGAIGLALGALLTWSNLDGVRGYHLPPIDVNTAALQRGAGDREGAVRRLERALAADPGDAVGWELLAVTLDELGRTDAAMAARAEAARARAAALSP